MNKQNRAVTISLAAMGVFLSTGSLAASPFDEAASERSIEQCVAQIGEQANYDDASGVRHEVATLKRQVVGQLLKIDTKVYGGDEDGQVIREYATTCVIGRDGAPLTLRIRQTNSEA